MRYFYDTEFVEDGRTIDLISIAVVCEDGREYYAHVDKYDHAKAAAHPFVSEHVLPHVEGMPLLAPEQVKAELAEFFLGNIDLWGYFPAWDHIALMQLWGSFTDQPPWLPMRTNDICTFAQLTGQGILPQPEGAHDALVDARWTRDAFFALAAGVGPEGA